MTSRVAESLNDRQGLLAAVVSTDAEFLVDTWADELATGSGSDSVDVFDQELDVPDWLLSAVSRSDVDTQHRSDGSSSSDAPGRNLF